MAPNPISCPEENRDFRFGFSARTIDFDLRSFACKRKRNKSDENINKTLIWMLIEMMKLLESQLCSMYIRLEVGNFYKIVIQIS